MSWLPDLWGTDGSDRPVWRLEFQYRRAVLAEFNLSGVDEVVASVQDLWRYGTEEWVSLRVSTNHSIRRRRPVDPVWEEIRAVRIIPTMTGVVRRRLEEANELKLLQELQGYATSLAARRGRMQLTDAMEDFGTLVSGYLTSRGRGFTEEVKRKQARQLRVTAFLEGVHDSGGLRIAVTGRVYVNVARLRREIALRGWRQADLARVAGVSAGTITTVMKGGPVSPGTLRKIAAALTRHIVVPGLDDLLADTAA